MDQKKQKCLNGVPAAMIAALAAGTSPNVATATEPCGGLGECKALVEINSSDGDIGFHFLMDGDDVRKARVENPAGRRIFKAEAYNQLREQRFTETFVESAEPLCFDPLTDGDPENDDEDFVTLEDFLDRWEAGTYTFIVAERGDREDGQSPMTFDLPAAPTNLAFDSNTGAISWAPGNDLGECADSAALDALVTAGELPQHPQDVNVAAWEIVFEPDVDDGDPTGALKFTVRVAGDIAVRSVTVPAEYLADLPEDTPAKIEIGAIGDEDNATFTETGDICVNEVMGCE